MGSRRYLPSAVILITICLDVSSIVVGIAVDASIERDPGISRYDSYNLDKGPVFYEAYYPDYVHDAYQKERNAERNREVLETSFQVPLERFAYSAEIANRPVSIILDEDKDLRQTANVEEISKLVRRAISRDLEDWNILERYLDRVSMNQNWQRRIDSRENREGEDYNFPFQDHRRSSDLSRQLNLETLQKLEARDIKQPSNYFEEIDTGGNIMIKKTSDAQTAEPTSIDVASVPLLAENIFQPRPQIIRYTFFKKPTSRPDQAEKIIDNSTPRNYGDNLIRQEIADKNSRMENKNVKKVKVTSIEVSKLPRHKTRHHHGEWPKRDYSIHRRQSEEKKSKDA